MSKYSLTDLLDLMAALRDPDFGCPWDLKQSLQSLIPYTLEEAYEVAETIEQQDMDSLRQELGDLLFQVVFYAQIAKENGDFEFEDVSHEIVSKLLRRHPHVFPDGTLASAGTRTEPIDEAEVAKNWELIKQQERDARQPGETEQRDSRPTSRLDDVPQALPAVLRATKLQSRAAQDGFDWEHRAGVLEKLREEITELEVAIEQQDQAAIDEELGDLLFTCVNLARWLKVSPEQSLRAANAKFEKRFRLVEAAVADSSKQMQELSATELDKLWQAAKNVQ